MRYNARHIAYLLCGITMLLCLACGGSGSSEESVVPVQPKLQINVFTTGHPMVTRGDVGDVDGDEDEQTIHKLQIWVFEHNDGKKVAYLEDTNPKSQLHNDAEGDILEGTYQLVVSNSFAEAKPNVDVFVLANGDQNGFPTLGGNATRDDLQNVLIEKSAMANETIDPYGLTDLTTTVPDGGLPMSGILKDVELGGQSPVLNVKSAVTVVRMVSKVRFIFSRNTLTQEEKSNNVDFRITQIKLDASMIPTQEYIFLTTPYKSRAFRVGDSYDGARVLVEEDKSITECDTPSKYAYISQGGKEYEEMINEGISKNELTPLGKFYFRESDKQMKGTIYYEISEGTEGSDGYKVTSKEARFVMNSAGDFTRNHTWIVYGYFAGSDNLQVISVKINPWTDRDDEHEVYNW
jgi:hypothetical protein